MKYLHTEYTQSLTKHYYDIGIITVTTTGVYGYTDEFKNSMLYTPSSNFRIYQKNFTAYPIPRLYELSEAELFQESTLYDAYTLCEAQIEIMKHVNGTIKTIIGGNLPLYTK
ncbi:hypothetical protein I4544_09200 [Klebsiella michiganensis]|uniref:hypothetical protein n=1 Tax=Klebsiella michiganensis TaxID=1134687 RepID=UPI0018C66AFE|nr:hypothetical protein [Klebsiella michiganensis]MBG2586422.1 hypothetical protein [Klebsiella michiganensis]